MVNEPKHHGGLRLVKREPVAPAVPVPEFGIRFECVAERTCPHCKTVIPLTGTQPLSHASCPSCGCKAFVPGRVGGFLLHGRIGEGEMGTLYRATDESLQREVAIKLVSNCHANDPEFRERLRQEACAAGKLNHPRVAQVYALNFSDKQPYLVMELVTGEDFDAKLKREGHIDEREALRMALDVAEGLSALDREGLAHGDIKPGNVVLDRDNNAKLVDFGLSGMMRRDNQGRLLGTPHYIAPELLRGATDSNLSDLYSLGAMLYHLLAGRPPFDGDTAADVVKARLIRKPTPLETVAKHVSPATRLLVMQLIAFNPEDRPVNSDAVAVEIRRLLALLDARAAKNTSELGGWNRLLARVRFPSWRRPSGPQVRRILVVAGIIGVFATVIILLIGTGGESIRHAWKGLSQTVVTFLKSATSDGLLDPAGAMKADADPVNVMRLPMGTPSGDRVTPPEEFLTTERKPVWNNRVLGDQTQHGGIIQTGGDMMIQGTGTDMWRGYDRCMFVWTGASGNYALSAQFVSIARANTFDVTCLLVKGDNPAKGPGLCFGFLGTGELFLQIRHDDNTAAIIRRSASPIQLPCHLKIERRDQEFDAWVSANGTTWNLFATCELNLPADNLIGFTVSSQIPGTLATARLANIHQYIPTPPSPE